MLQDRLKLLQRQLARTTETKSSFGMREWYQSVATATEAELDHVSEEYRVRKELIVIADGYSSNLKLRNESEAILPWLSEDTPREMTSEHLCLNIRALGVQKLHEILDEQKSDVMEKGFQLQEYME